MEKILNINLPRENANYLSHFEGATEKLSFALGTIIEPGNFVVDQNHLQREEILLEIHKKFVLSHFQESSVLPGTNIASDLRAQSYFTYGDAISVRMYQKLGFKVADRPPARNYLIYLAQTEMIFITHSWTYQLKLG